MTLATLNTSLRRPLPSTALVQVTETSRPPAPSMDARNWAIQSPRLVSALVGAARVEVGSDRVPKAVARLTAAAHRRGRAETHQPGYGIGDVSLRGCRRHACCRQAYVDVFTACRETTCRLSNPLLSKIGCHADQMTVPGSTSGQTRAGKQASQGFLPPFHRARSISPVPRRLHTEQKPNHASTRVRHYRHRHRPGR